MISPASELYGLLWIANSILSRKSRLIVRNIHDCVHPIQSEPAQGEAEPTSSLCVVLVNLKNSNVACAVGASGMAATRRIGTPLRMIDRVIVAAACAARPSAHGTAGRARWHVGGCVGFSLGHVVVFQGGGR